jgi:general secretion pathway protein G
MSFAKEVIVHNVFSKVCAIFGPDPYRVAGAEKGYAMRVIKPSVRAAEQGFTLLEIMVVVVIIGLLAAMVVPSLMSNVDTAQISRTKQDIRGIETALNLYRLDNFRYPSGEDGLQALVTNPGETAAPNWQQKLKKVPLDPWNQPYQYLNPGRHSEFDVFSFGADGQEGGEGLNADIGNWDLD